MSRFRVAFLAGEGEPLRQQVSRLAGPAVPDLSMSDAEVRRRIGLSEKAWRTAKQSLERQGMPRPDPLTGKRYWPAVRAFVDRRHGLATMPVAAHADGEENLDAL